MAKIGIEMLKDLQHFYNQCGRNLHQTSQVANLRSLFYHRGGRQAEIEVKYHDQHEGHQTTILCQWTEIAFEGFFNGNTLKEVACRIETFHFTQQTDCTAQALRILAVLLPNAFDTRRFQVRYVVLALVELLGRDV